MIADEIDMIKDYVRNISVQDLGMRKLAAKLTLQNLTKEQNDRCLSLCIDFLDQLRQDNFLDRVIMMMKHGVISMILRPKASQWSGD
jgi:hypothetical protein